MGERGPVPKGYTRRRNKRYSSGTSVIVARPSLPRALPEEGKAEWRRVVPQLEEIGLLATIDRGVLIRYCQAWADWVRVRTAAGTLREADPGTEGQPRPQPGLADEAGRRAGDRGPRAPARADTRRAAASRREARAPARPGRGGEADQLHRGVPKDDVRAMTTTNALQIEHVDIETLRPDPANPRRISRRRAGGADAQPARVGLRPAGAGAARGQRRHRRPPAAARRAPPRHEDRAGDLRRPDGRAGAHPQHRPQQDQRRVGRRAARPHARRPAAVATST